MASLDIARNQAAKTIITKAVAGLVGTLAGEYAGRWIIRRFFKSED